MYIALLQITTIQWYNKRVEYPQNNQLLGYKKGRKPTNNKEKNRKYDNN
jgi:hypothetical protein